MTDLVRQVPALTDEHAIRQGADARVTLTLLDAASDPWDLTGYTMKAEIREQTAGATTRGPLRGTWTVDSANAASGEFVLTMAGAATAAIPVNIYRWDALLTGPGGEIEHMLSNSVRVVPGVTDPAA
ncbi:MAG: hypothetical protein AAF414_17190 [Pseudomonadota bacterium]